jgi:hypothetical protein
MALHLLHITFFLPFRPVFPSVFLTSFSLFLPSCVCRHQSSSLLTGGLCRRFNSANKSNSQADDRRSQQCFLFSAIVPPAHASSTNGRRAAVSLRHVHSGVPHDRPSVVCRSWINPPVNSYPCVTSTRVFFASSPLVGSTVRPFDHVQRRQPDVD